MKPSFSTAFEGIVRACAAIAREFCEIGGNAFVNLGV